MAGSEGPKYPNVMKYLFLCSIKKIARALSMRGLVSSENVNDARREAIIETRRTAPASKMIEIAMQ